MESFGAALDRLTKKLVSELIAAVEVAALERLSEERQEETSAKPTRFVRPSHPEPAAAQNVVVRSFDIPVGQPRRRRRSAAGSAPRRIASPAAETAQPTFKFEVIPHPDRKNRRIVMTRVSS